MLPSSYIIQRLQYFICPGFPILMVSKLSILNSLLLDGSNEVLSHFLFPAIQTFTFVRAVHRFGNTFASSFYSLRHDGLTIGFSFFTCCFHTCCAAIIIRSCGVAVSIFSW